MLDRLGVGDDHRALPEVVEQQSRKHDDEPGEADRAPAEMTHVGVQRFAAGHDQEHAAENQESEPPVAREELQSDAPG